MPELPDVEVYLSALRSRIRGQPLEAARLGSPFLVRTVEPPLSSFLGRRVESLHRLGKRIVFGFEGDLFAVLHLMIAGRLHWKPRGAKFPGKVGLAAFDFPAGTLTLTEAGSKKRAAPHLVKGEAGLAAHDPGGLEVLEADLDAFREVLVAESHTLKRALTDPHLFSGIGNAYSARPLARRRGNDQNERWRDTVWSRDSPAPGRGRDTRPARSYVRRPFEPPGRSNPTWPRPCTVFTRSLVALDHSPLRRH
ncbi:MAG TPA: DNA-formamidopyrimidine glycosylase family protein [Thermoanaerobaculia bacterium]|nr:DNA-formamidopyrimidine glycosylase family protein [Thermoanaerobaculia bacterium]